MRVVFVVLVSQTTIVCLFNGSLFYVSLESSPEIEVQYSTIVGKISLLDRSPSRYSTYCTVPIRRIVRCSSGAMGDQFFRTTVLLRSMGGHANKISLVMSQSCKFVLYL